MNELINAIRFNKTPAFRDKYRSIDDMSLAREEAIAEHVAALRKQRDGR